MELLQVRFGISGRGVFALQAMESGRELLRYEGPHLTYAQTTPQTLAVQIGPDLYLGESGRMDDFVNHSCEPNAGLVINGLDVRLIAIRSIAVGEEICFDYSTTMDEDDFEMKCLCGRPTCRGLVRDFKHLSADLRRKYITLGVVPAYNRRYS